MEILHIEDESKGSFYIAPDGEKLAELFYSKAGTDRIIINHTEVSGVLKSTGAGKKLVSKAVDYARENGISIIPLCSFARKVFQETPEYKDVL